MLAKQDTELTQSGGVTAPVVRATAALRIVKFFSLYVGLDSPLGGARCAAGRCRCRRRSRRLAGGPRGARGVRVEAVSRGPAATEAEQACVKRVRVGLAEHRVDTRGGEHSGVRVLSSASRETRLRVPRLGVDAGALGGVVAPAHPLTSGLSNGRSHRWPAGRRRPGPPTAAASGPCCTSR